MKKTQKTLIELIVGGQTVFATLLKDVVVLGHQVRTRLGVLDVIDVPIDTNLTIDDILAMRKKNKLNEQ